MDPQSSRFVAKIPASVYEVVKKLPLLVSSKTATRKTEMDLFSTHLLSQPARVASAEKITENGMTAAPSSLSWSEVLRASVAIGTQPDVNILKSTTISVAKITNRNAPVRPSRARRDGKNSKTRNNASRSNDYGKINNSPRLPCNNENTPVSELEKKDLNTNVVVQNSQSSLSEKKSPNDHSEAIWSGSDDAIPEGKSSQAMPTEVEVSAPTSFDPSNQVGKPAQEKNGVKQGPLTFAQRVTLSIKTLDLTPKPKALVVSRTIIREVPARSDEPADFKGKSARKLVERQVKRQIHPVAASSCVFRVNKEFQTVLTKEVPNKSAKMIITKSSCRKSPSPPLSASQFETSGFGTTTKGKEHVMKDHNSIPLIFSSNENRAINTVSKEFVPFHDDAKTISSAKLSPTTVSAIAEVNLPKTRVKLDSAFTSEISLRNLLPTQIHKDTCLSLPLNTQSKSTWNKKDPPHKIDEKISTTNESSAEESAAAFIPVSPKILSQNGDLVTKSSSLFFSFNNSGFQNSGASPMLPSTQFKMTESQTLELKNQTQRGKKNLTNNLKKNNSNLLRKSLNSKENDNFFEHGHMKNQIEHKKHEKIKPEQTKNAKNTKKNTVTANGSRKGGEIFLEPIFNSQPIFKAFNGQNSCTSFCNAEKNIEIEMQDPLSKLAQSSPARCTDRAQISMDTAFPHVNTNSPRPSVFSMISHNEDFRNMPITFRQLLVPFTPVYSYSSDGFSPTEVYYCPGSSTESLQNYETLMHHSDPAFRSTLKIQGYVNFEHDPILQQGQPAETECKGSVPVTLRDGRVVDLSAYGKEHFYPQTGATSTIDRFAQCGIPAANGLYFYEKGFLNSVHAQLDKNVGVYASPKQKASPLKTDESFDGNLYGLSLKTPPASILNDIGMINNDSSTLTCLEKNHDVRLTHVDSTCDISDGFNSHSALGLETNCISLPLAVDTTVQESDDNQQIPETEAQSVIPGDQQKPYCFKNLVLPYKGHTLDEKICWQVLFYFSDENLVKDFYLRSVMDCKGYVNFDLVASFNRISNLTANRQHVRRALAKCPTLEFSHDGTGIRRREGWEQWIFSAPKS